MIKKVTSGIIVIILALSAFFYVQINSAREQVIALLNQQQIQFSALNLHFFPSPQISLETPHFSYQDQRIGFKQATVKLALFPLLSGRFVLERLQLTQGHFSATDWILRDAEFSDTNLSSDNWASFVERLKNPLNFDRTLAEIHFHLNGNLSSSAQDELHFSANFTLGNRQLVASAVKILLDLQKPTYNGNRQFAMAWHESRIERTEAEKYVIAIQDLNLNQALLGSPKILLDTARQEVSVTQLCQDCMIMGHWQERSDKKMTALFRLNAMPLDRVLTAVKLPVIASGSTDFSAVMLWQDRNLLESEFYSETHKGELLGLNLLSLAGQYLPINYDEQALQSKNMDMAFNKLSVRSRWESGKLLFDNIELDTSTIVAQGHGISNWFTMQCDVTLNIGLREYPKFVLPIRFFDRCDSPQYEIKFNKNFRDQLRSLLQEKLLN
ncbi:MAG: hypothetical protein SOX56_02895 [[Pasteurella] mairii]|uniref:Membrane protein n=1 Tax=[Pasteurella] mairii TaxID=757 RepID=A0A379B2D8_9PAST|nr:hypothetical protein [[Pasteurella] mairii]SUB32783.1 membrane protein [[Pasteurella] mairii]